MCSEPVERADEAPRARQSPRIAARERQESAKLATTALDAANIAPAVETTARDEGARVGGLK